MLFCCGVDSFYTTRAAPHRKNVPDAAKCDIIISAKQVTISVFNDEPTQIRTKKKEFPSQIERIVP